MKITNSAFQILPEDPEIDGADQTKDRSRKEGLLSGRTSDTRLIMAGSEIADQDRKKGPDNHCLPVWEQDNDEVPEQSDKVEDDRCLLVAKAIAQISAGKGVKRRRQVLRKNILQLMLPKS